MCGGGFYYVGGVSTMEHPPYLSGVQKCQREEGGCWYEEHGKELKLRFLEDFFYQKPEFSGEYENSYLLLVVSLVVLKTSSLWQNSPLTCISGRPS